MRVDVSQLFFFIAFLLKKTPRPGGLWHLAALGACRHVVALLRPAPALWVEACVCVWGGALIILQRTRRPTDAKWEP